MKLKRDIATLVYPQPSNIVETLNGHAKLNKWLRKNLAPTFKHRFELYNFVEQEYIKGEKIQYLEFGVHEGESIKKWTDIHRNPESRFTGFDTFTGLPTDWGDYLKSGHFDTGGMKPELDDERASFIAGLFQQTLPVYLREHQSTGRLVIHNDSDLYSSTLYTLTMLHDLMVPGTIIIFDEFASPLHEFRAWNDFLDSYMRKATLIGSSGPYAEQAAFIFE